jgi:hypothetical protein
VIRRKVRGWEKNLPDPDTLGETDSVPGVAALQMGADRQSAILHFHNDETLSTHEWDLPLLID